MDETEESGRVGFGDDVTAALKHWAMYSDFPDGFNQVAKVLEVLRPLLGDVTDCYALTSRRYVAVQQSALTGNSMYANWGNIWVTPGSETHASESGIDLRKVLASAGLVVHDEPERGITVWNARGIRERAPSAGQPVRRTCPRCHLQWAARECPDCEIDLLEV